MNFWQRLIAWLFGGATVARMVPVRLEQAVIRWNPIIEKYRGATPLIFVDDWIQIESGGLTGPRSTYFGAKGVGQLNAGEYKQAGNYDADRAVDDGEYAIRALMDFIHNVAEPRVQRSIAANGLAWKPMQTTPTPIADVVAPDPSYWAMVKLVHAWPAGVEVFPAGFVKDRGRAPGTFRELAAWVEDNADEIVDAHPGWKKADMLSALPNCINAASGVEGGDVPPTPRTGPPLVASAASGSVKLAGGLFAGWVAYRVIKALATRRRA